MSLQNDFETYLYWVVLMINILNQGNQEHILGWGLAAFFHRGTENKYGRLLAKRQSQGY